MEFSRDSGIIINQIIPSISRFYDVRELEIFTEKLYYIIEDGEKYYKRICPIKPVVYEKNKCYKPTLLKSHFVPNKIKKYIIEEIKYQIEYECVILDRKITIRIDAFEQKSAKLSQHKKYEKYISFICIFIHMFANISRNKCSKSLVIHLSLTQLKKKLPYDKEKIISIDNVNSAVTLRCSEEGVIFIYREEEWMKVFIHEAIHSFGLDIDDNIALLIQEGMKNIFSINSVFNVYEAYTETWARILNCAYCSYVSSKQNKESILEFKTYYNFCIIVERIFALLQLQKILRFKKLYYKNLFENNTHYIMRKDNVYNEDKNTSVFAYYILSGLFMKNYNDFILWCYNNNKNILDFKNTHQSGMSFLILIQDICHIDSYINNFRNLYNSNNKFMSSTTRMSAIQLSL